jgi:hypothetical protein
MTLDEQLDFFDEHLRRLKVKYDLFFAGASRLPPTEDRRRLDNLLHEMAGTHIRDNGKRYRFNTLVARFNQFRELWSRLMREREEGPTDYRRRKAALEGIDEVVPAQRQTPPPRQAVTQQDPESYVSVAPGTNGEAFRAIYSQIADAQQKLGKGPGWTLDQVTAMVEKQADALRARFGVQTIAFRVETVEGKVKLKAKPL